MHIAALIAHVQQVRINKGYEPLKPYEARAHLRQWSAKEFGEGFRPARTPDAIRWLIGTGVISEEEGELYLNKCLKTK